RCSIAVHRRQTEGCAVRAGEVRAERAALSGVAGAPAARRRAHHARRPLPVCGTPCGPVHRYGYDEGTTAVRHGGGRAPGRREYRPHQPSDSLLQPDSTEWSRLDAPQQSEAASRSAQGDETQGPTVTLWVTRSGPAHRLPVRLSGADEYFAPRACPLIGNISPALV